MDISVKFRCSLKWLSGILPESLQNLNGQALSGILLEPYKDGRLKKDLILSLTNPSLYVSAYEVLFPGEHMEPGSFEPLIHSLAKKGGYVLEDDTNIVTGPMLAQEVPFMEKSHLALLDVFMLQYASKCISVHKVVRTVRQISSSTFNASKELPSKIQVDLLLILWLNKVSERVCIKLEEEVNNLVYDPDPRQRKRNKAALTDNLTVPLIKGDLYGGIYDGQVLAALLLFYVPSACNWNDFNLSDHPLTQRKILTNLQFVCDYCSVHLPAPGFHLSPNELIECGQSSLLDANILALLAHLFYCFETKVAEDFNLKKSSSSSLAMQPASAISGTSSVLRPPAQNQSRASLHCASNGSISKPLKDAATSRLKHPLYSQSAGPLLAVPNRLATPQSQVSTSNSASTVQSQAVKLESKSQQSGIGRTFNAPLRTSLNMFQSKALATFGKDQLSLMKGALSQSSPLIQATPAQVGSSASSELISISTDNLHIEKQIGRHVRIRKKGSMIRQQKTPLDVSHRSSKPHTSFIDGDCTSSDNRDVPLNALNSGSCSPSPGPPLDKIPSPSPPLVKIPRSEAVLPVSSAIPVAVESGNLSPAQQVRGSFTLNKQHTYASASAAGLPIINDKEKLADNVDEMPSKLQPREMTELSDTTKPTSGKTRTSEAVMLTNILQLHRGESKYTIATQKQPIPANVKELRVNLRSFITSLHSESVYMEREARIQRLRLYQPNRAKSNGAPSGDPLSSRSAIIRSTTPSASEPGMAQGAVADIGLTASASLSTLDKVLHPQRAPASSLEQFERDEFLIQLQCSPRNLIQTGPAGSENRSIATEQAAHGTDVAGDAHGTDYQPIQQLYLSPISSSGQVFVEQTPSTHYITDVQPRVAASEDTQVPVSNPWMKPLDQNSQIQKLKKKEELIKSKIEERDQARRMAAEQRAEHRKREEQAQHKKKQKKGNRKTDHHHDHHHAGLEDSPRHRHQSMDTANGTIHFQLSTHPPDQQPATGTPEQAAYEPVAVHVYAGPECYVKPKGKSNLKIIRNAICAVCLAGEVNLTLKQKTLYELENTAASHVVILFRDTIGFKFRGIYSYNPGDRHVMRIYGTGPKELKESMISHVYKYNSGQKEFKEIPSRSLSVSVDGLTIKSEHWHTARRKTAKAIL